MLSGRHLAKSIANSLTIVVSTNTIAAMARESKKEKPPKVLGNREETAYHGIQKAAEELKTRINDLLKAHDLTVTQYNVLRILRTANVRGASCSLISESLATKDSDITRMLERMEAGKLIRRERHKDDRRVMLAFIAEKGLAILEALDTPVDNLYKNQFANLSKKDLDKLVKLLRKVASHN